MVDRVPQTSFIPKQGVSQPARAIPSKRVYVLGYVSLIVFMTTVLATLGTVLYKISVDKQLQQVINDFTKEENNFDHSIIAAAKTLDNRLAVANNLLNNHNAVSEAFAALEETVTDRVTYTSFSYSSGGGESAGEQEIKFEGKTDNFDAVVFQREEYATNPILSSAKLSNIGYGVNAPSGEGAAASLPSDTSITFTVTEKLTPSELAYTAAAVAESFGAEPVDTSFGTSTTETVASSSPLTPSE